MKKLNFLTSAKIGKNLQISKWAEYFLIKILFAFISNRGKCNYTNLSKHSEMCSKTYQNGHKYNFNFGLINSTLIKKGQLENKVGKEMILAIDASYISKSGKKTSGVGHFWSGTKKAVCWGLEITNLAMVDVENKTAYHLYTEQNMPNKNKKEDKETYMIENFIEIIKKMQPNIIRFTKYIVGDAFYAKSKFINGVVEMGFEVITKFNKNANFKYLYEGERTGKRGAPKKYEGKVNFEDLDLTKFKYLGEKAIENGVIIHLYECILQGVAYKRKLKVVVCNIMSEKEPNKVSKQFILGSTDLELDGCKIFEYYKARFQQEFLFRDAKQHTGLEDCQGRKAEQLHHHFNISLTAVSVAKFEFFKKGKPFSLNNEKIRLQNELFIEKIISIYEKKGTLDKNSPEYLEILHFGLVA
jgi:Transposase DDE domain